MIQIELQYVNFVFPYSEGEGSGGSEESESEEEVVEEGVTVKRKKKHRRKSKFETSLLFEECMFGFPQDAHCEWSENFRHKSWYGHVLRHKLYSLDNHFKY